MMALCPYCHAEATEGAMAEPEQRVYKAKPYNKVRGYADGTLKINQGFPAITLGPIMWVGEGPLIRIDGRDILAIHSGERGNLEISVALLDSADNMLALIEHNEWMTGDASVWDIIAKFQRLEIKRKAGEISLSVDARDEVLRVRGQLWGSGIRVVASRKELCVYRNHKASFQGGLALVGIAFDINSAKLNFNLVPVYSQAKLISEVDPQKRLSMARESWRKIMENPQPSQKIPFITNSPPKQQGTGS
jgi:hypothetical protein